MGERLKKSRKSPNFWSDIAFLVSGVVIAAVEYYGQHTPEKTMLQGILIAAINKGANIMAHLYSDK
jgi:hypothetical protein